MSFSGKSRKSWQEDRPPYLAAFSHFTPLVRTAALAVPHRHSRSCDYACAQSVIRVTAACVLAHNAQTTIKRGPSARHTRGDARWTRYIFGIKPKPVCGWQRGCRGIIQREANSWSLPKNSSGRPRNSKRPPAQNEGLHAECDSRRKSARLAAPSAQHQCEQFPFIFKRLDRNPAPPSCVISSEKEEERTCEP